MNKTKEKYKRNIDSINDAVISFCDKLKFQSGSDGEIDLYKLMQVYLNDNEKRKQINEILFQFKTNSHNRILKNGERWDVIFMRENITGQFERVHIDYELDKPLELSDSIMYNGELVRVSGVEDLEDERIHKVYIANRC
ncbi:hypothetical protein ACFFVB_18455 [Formosa undariae]|uniref:Uncharacterized protein n=1 Tax=Formosa undariae TaxID=1325436 RepID=A0ABV5F6R7_9FLAO